MRLLLVEDDLEIRDPEFLGGAARLTKTLTTADPKIAVICPKREEFIAGYYRNQPRHLITYGRLSGEVYCAIAKDMLGPNGTAPNGFNGLQLAADLEQFGPVDV